MKIASSPIIPSSVITKLVLAASLRQDGEEKGGPLEHCSDRKKGLNGWVPTIGGRTMKMQV